MSTPLDEHGQPVTQALTWRRNFEKSLESLLGLCGGLIADGHLNEREILFLDTWLKQNKELLTRWPADVIAKRLRMILADGEITHDEAEDLRRTLESIVGGGLEETGAAGGMATRLPCESVDTIHFVDKSFCLTGHFLYGSRKACEKVVIDRGGIVRSGVTMDLSYLIIGTLASRDWIATSHGRKIEAAIKNKEKGCSVVILAEEMWVKHLR